MSDFNYDAYQEELKEQKQQWRHDLLAERKEEERHREKFIPFYSAAVLVSFLLTIVLILLLEFDFELRKNYLFNLSYAVCLLGLYSALPIIQFTKKYQAIELSKTIQNTDEILPSVAKKAPHAYCCAIFVAVCFVAIFFIINFAPFFSLLENYGHSICCSLAILGLVFSMYLTKCFWQMKAEKSK